MRSNRPFLLLLVLFVAGVLAQNLTLPVMEGSDESIHSTYVELLRAEGRLPDRATFRTNNTRQESGQPPLTYWLAAQAANLFGLPSTGPQLMFDHLDSVHNTWLTPPDAWNRRDNLNHFLHGERAFGAPEIVAINRALRLTSLAYGVLAVVAAYGAAREVFRQQHWALTATAIFAFMPTMLHLASYLNNDISAVAFATLALWLSLRLLRRGATPLSLLALGLVLALGALSKVSVLLIAPAAGLAVVLDARNRRDGIGRLVANGVLVAAPLLVLFGPWVLWGWVNYRDPFGFMTHRHPTLSYDTLLSPSQLLRLMPEVYLSYWAKFGLAKVYLHPVVYTLMGVLLVFSLAGYARLGLRLSRQPQPFRAPSRRLALQQALILGMAIIVVFIGLIRWMQEIAIITGRLMYPAHIAVAIGFTGGLYGMAQCSPVRSRVLRGYAVGLIAVSGIVLSPVALYQAFMPPRMLAREDLPPLQGGPVDYEGTIRLLGMTQETPVLSGSMHTVTLCWEVLREAERRAAFSVKLVRDGVIVADRTSFHGLGHYPSPEWAPGAIFCDDVDLPYDDPDVPDDPQPQPGTIYDVLVVLLDARTREVDWQATLSDGREIQFPFVGQVVSPAGDMSAMVSQRLETTSIEFPGFARLAGYHITGEAEAGGTLDLELLWDVTGETRDRWKQFIHLSGENGAYPVADGDPRGGKYPTWAWSRGERVIDRWMLQLPGDLPPGSYALAIGFYREDTGERMPVTADGQQPDDRAARLTTVTVTVPDS